MKRIGLLCIVCILIVKGLGCMLKIDNNAYVLICSGF